MGSKQRPFCHLSLTRLQLLLANKKLSFLVSILLVSILYQTQAPHGLLSSSSNKRKGLGGGDASGELHSVLRRKQEGRAAVAIIRVTDDIDPSNASAEPQTKYLVQIKSHDYPIPPFRGSVCLLGGNANTNDGSPVDTLIRELNEELGALSWINKIAHKEIIDDSSLIWEECE